MHMKMNDADMKRKQNKRWDDGLPLSGEDAKRLVLDAVERLGADGRGRSETIRLVKRVVELGVAAVAAEEATESFERAAWASVEARQGRRASTVRDLRHYVRRMLKEPGIGSRPLRAMTTKECRALLHKAFGQSVHSYRKARAILHSIFAYGMRQEWCDANPVSRIEVPPVTERTIEPLSSESARKLVDTASQGGHRAMLFSLYLMLYSGLRPGEVQRLQPERDVIWQERVLVVRPVVSKTGGGRMVTLRLPETMKRQECTIPHNWEQKWRALRRAAGFEHWVPDVCRHTFASYHAAYFRNLPALQLEMGHRDLGLLRCRYMVPVLRREAERFWRGCHIK